MFELHLTYKNIDHLHEERISIAGLTKLHCFVDDFVFVFVPQNLSLCTLYLHLQCFDLEALSTHIDSNIDVFNDNTNTYHIKIDKQFKSYKVLRQKIGKLIDMDTLIHSYSPSNQSKQATPTLQATSATLTTRQCIQFDLADTTTNPNLDYQSNSNNKVELEILDLLDKCLDNRIKELVQKLGSILTPIAQDYQSQLNRSISILEKVNLYYKIVKLLDEDRRYKFFDKKLRKSLRNSIESYSDLFNILKYMIHVLVSATPTPTLSLSLSFNKTALLCYLDKKEIQTLGRKVVVLNNDLNQDNLLDKLQSGDAYVERLKQYINHSQTIPFPVPVSFYLLTNEQYQLLKQEYQFSDLEFLDE